MVDRIDEAKLDDARIALGEFMDDPVIRSLMTAPLDDEPLTDEDVRAMERARLSPKRDDDEVDRLLEDASRRLVG